jgi:hypothetical protein
MVRVFVVGLVLVVAAHAPFKYEDRRVGPFGPEVSALADLGTSLRAESVWLQVPEGHEADAIALPVGPLPLRSLLSIVQVQTGLRPSIGYCGNGMTVLHGAHPIGAIRLVASP